MKIHLIDSTYEFFRNHFGAPPKQVPDGQEIGATLSLLRSLLALLARPEVTHVAYVNEGGQPLTDDKVITTLNIQG